MEVTLLLLILVELVKALVSKLRQYKGINLSSKKLSQNGVMVLWKEYIGSQVDRKELCFHSRMPSTLPYTRTVIVDFLPPCATPLCPKLLKMTIKLYPTRINLPKRRTVRFRQTSFGTCESALEAA